MDALLTKPFSTAQLSEALAEVLPVRGPVDVAALARLGADVGDEDAVRRVATIFVDGLPDLRASLDRARRQGDGDELRRLGHRLRASSATFGAHRLAKLAAFLESHGTPELVDAIDRESRRVADRLRAELAR
jgi:HPt (histidine-containing phosphotransfer) domain-containing protein